MQRTIAIALLAAVASVGCSTISSTHYRRDTRTLLGTRKNDIERCYDEVLKTDPSASGKVTVKFTVKKKTGVLKKIKVSKSDAPEALQNCVTENLAGLALAPPYKENGRAKFTYEFAAADNGDD